MPTNGELATFLPDDPDCLILASLACPVCLSGDVEWSLELGGYDSSVECECGGCGHRRRLFVTADQALRLSMHETCPLDPIPRPIASLMAT